MQEPQAEAEIAAELEEAENEVAAENVMISNERRMVP